MKPEYIYVTKEMAQKWLDTNYFNRTLNKDTVNLYVNQMNSGEWICNTDGIAIDKKGILRNGQHRLTALLKSDVNGVWMLVCFDCDEKGVYDKGRVRTTKDAIYMNGGRKYDTTLVGTAKLALVVTGRSYGRTIPDTWVEQWLEERIETIETLLPKTSGIHKKASIYLAAISAVENGVSIDSVKEWLEIVRTGLYSQPYQEAAVRFRNWLIGYGSITANEQVAILKTAQNNIAYFSAGKNCKKIYEAKNYTYEIH